MNPFTSYVVKQAKLHNYEVDGDVQGGGLRKTLHGILDETGRKGFAVNDARTGKVHITFDGPSPRKVLKELLKHIATETDVVPKFNKTNVSKPLMNISLSAEDIAQFRKRQGFQRDAWKDDSGLELQKKWLAERWRLRHNGDRLEGEVSELGAKQLRGEEPIYHQQLNKPHEFGSNSFSKQAEVLAHIAGPSGSGKSTLLKQIQKQYPNCIVKDLDSLDDDINRRPRNKMSSNNQTVQISRQPSAVIIKGNPMYVKGNKLADKLYNQLADYLRDKKYTVTFDKGESHTVPPPANIWIGHSRGADRLRFAPKGTKTLDLNDYEHPVARAAQARQTQIKELYGAKTLAELPPELRKTPPPHHYFFTKEMRKQIDKLTNKVH